MRALLVALLVATPSLLLAQHTSDTVEIAVLLAIIAALLTFLDYNTSYPSIVEFRDAPPINRLRFIALFSIVFFLSITAKHQFEPTNLTAMVAGLGGVLGDSVDFPYSPVRLVLLMLPPGSTAATVSAVRTARANKAWRSQIASSPSSSAPR